MTLILAIAIILLIVWEFGPYIALFGGIIVACVIFALVVQAIVDSNQLKGIEYTELLGRTKVMDVKTRPSGFSVGSRGSVRTYWRFREEVDHIDVDFRVHYQDGRVCKVTAREGSGKCDKLYSYIGKPKPKPVGPPKPVVIEPPKIVEAQKSEAKPQNREKSKYYIEVPFEIAPNEYGLTISYPSCQVERTKDGERRTYVRFTATYDPTVKGLRNRVIICSLVNKDGKTMDVRRGSKVFDTSGSQMVDLMFWKLIDDEPARVVVGVDRYN